MLFSQFSTERSRSGMPLKISFIDVRKACFNGSPSREVYVKLPPELGFEQNYGTPRVQSYTLLLEMQLPGSKTLRGRSLPLLSLSPAFGTLTIVPARGRAAAATGCGAARRCCTPRRSRCGWARTCRPRGC